MVPADARDRRAALRRPARADVLRPGSSGYQALQWEADAVKNGWVSPGSVSMDDAVAFDKFTAGETAIVLATGPGNMATANDKSQSNIAGDAALALVPGVDGPGASFGLPEGLSIPVTAKHKAAAAAFIEWWRAARERDRDLQDQEGNLPCGASVDQAARRQRGAAGRRRA